jgi:hypothetical protein
MDRTWTPRALELKFKQTVQPSKGKNQDELDEMIRDQTLKTVKQQKSVETFCPSISIRK